MDATIPIGKSLVIDSTSLKPREYDAKVDAVEDIAGVSYPKVDTTGRISANVDGYEYNDKDYYMHSETGQYVYDENSMLVENPSYDVTFNPSTTSEYVVLAICGMCPVLNTETVPSRWVKIRDGITYDTYLVR
jgi:hypothetical protein